MRPPSWAASDRARRATSVLRILGRPCAAPGPLLRCNAHAAIRGTVTTLRDGAPALAVLLLRFFARQAQICNHLTEGIVFRAHHLP